MSKKSYNRATKHNRVQAVPCRRENDGEILTYDLYMKK